MTSRGRRWRKREFQFAFTYSISYLKQEGRFTYFATLAMQSMLYLAICSGITLHTASFSFNSGVRRRSSWEGGGGERGVNKRKKVGGKQERLEGENPDAFMAQNWSHCVQWVKCRETFPLSYSGRCGALNSPAHPLQAVIDQVCKYVTVCKRFISLSSSLFLHKTINVKTFCTTMNALKRWRRES